MATNFLKFIHYCYLANLRKPANAFVLACKKPAPVQAEILSTTLQQNSNTEYGRAMNFANIHSIDGFQQQIPVVTYEDLKPWIEKVCLGQSQVLTAEEVELFELTSGSSGGNKYIPYTAGLSTQFSNAIDPWFYHTYQCHPQLKGLQTYISLSPAARVAEETAGGIPIGMEDDTEYFSPFSRWAVKKMMAVPNRVGRYRDIQHWKHETAVYLLLAKNLGLISIWSPTFLTPILEYIQQHWDLLMASIDAKNRHRCRELVSIGSQFSTSELWPRLAVISCWTEGVSAQYLEGLRQWFPQVFIQAKGLMATECVISIPHYTSLEAVEQTQSYTSVLAVNSHFLEFSDQNNPRALPLLAHELKEGGIYSPIVTTAGGLYRYQLRDLCECLGYYQGAPLIRFLSKQDRVSDICGEKLHTIEVETALQHCSQQLGYQYKFALLVPNQVDRPRYTLYVEPGYGFNSAAIFAETLDSILQQNQHYHYCRQLGQLSNVEIVCIEDGYNRYVETLMANGLRYGDIKPAALETRFDWHGVFGPDHQVTDAAYFKTGSAL